jgi:hypothetical protein
MRIPSALVILGPASILTVGGVAVADGVISGSASEWLPRAFTSVAAIPYIDDGGE